MAPRRLIVYDLDGTLIDTCRALANATQVFVAAQADAVRAPLAARSAARGTPSPARMVPARSADALFAEAYKAELADGVRLMSGARRLLAHFRSRRIRRS